MSRRRASGASCSPRRRFCSTTWPISPLRSRSAVAADFAGGSVCPRRLVGADRTGACAQVDGHARRDSRPWPHWRRSRAAPRGLQDDDWLRRPDAARCPISAYFDALDLARNSDILFMCAAGGPRGSPPIIGRDILEALGPRGIFVNVSRGWLVDEGRLSSPSWRPGCAAGLDVFLDEPAARSRCARSTMSC